MYFPTIYKSYQKQKSINFYQSRKNVFFVGSLRFKVHIEDTALFCDKWPSTNTTIGEEKTEDFSALFSAKIYAKGQTDYLCGMSTTK